jgi:hypothetical protein
MAPNLNKIANRIEARPGLSPIAHIKEAVKEIGDYHTFRRSTTTYDIRRRINSVEKCSTYFEEVTVQSGEKQTVARHACNDSYFCPVCAENRSNKRYFTARDRIKKAVADGHRLYFVTMTVKDQADPYEQYDTLANGIREFQRIGQKGRSGEWSKVKGAYINFEAKKGEGSGMFHIHAHAILAVRGKLDYSVFKYPLKTLARNLGRRLTPEEVKAVPLLNEDGKSKIEKEWIQATGGKGAIFNVIPIKSKSILGANGEQPIDATHLKNLPGSDSNEQRNPIRELFKYPAKMADFIGDFSFNEIGELYDCLKGRRNFRATGFFAAGSNEYLPDEPLIRPLDDPNNLVVNHSTFRFRPGDIERECRFDEYSTKATATAFDNFHASGHRKELSQARGYILAEYNEIRRESWAVLKGAAFVDACKALCGLTKQFMRDIQETPRIYYHGALYAGMHERTGDTRLAEVQEYRRRRPTRLRTEQPALAF